MLDLSLSKPMSAPKRNTKSQRRKLLTQVFIDGRANKLVANQSILNSALAILHGINPDDGTSDFSDLAEVLTVLRNWERRIGNIIISFNEINKGD